MQKKIKDQFNSENGYKSRNIILKKVREIKMKIPENPAKKQQILMELTKDMTKKAPHKQLKVEPEINKTVRNFYLREDVSVILPGKKDTIAIKDNDGKKIIERKRVMVDSKLNLFKTFKGENPELKIGKTKFFSLTPPVVKSFLKMPEYSCLCKYHENFKKLFLCGKSWLVDKSIDTYDEFIRKSVCSVDNYDCMMNLCNGCRKFKVSGEFLFPRQVRLIFFQWELVNGQYKEKEHSHTSVQWIGKMKENLIEFKKHYYFSKIQSQKIMKDIREFPCDTVNIIFDFSENFCIQNQNEIQAAFYLRQHVTIFTAVAYFCGSDEDGKKVYSSTSYGIISDTKNHDKYSACTFIDFLIDLIFKKQSVIRFINLWSDGAPSHFKNRYSISNMIRLEQKYSTKIRWNFSATSHGKTQADGVGGTIKNMVDRRIKAQNLIISSSFEFYQTAQQICEIISIHFISESEICQQKIHFDAFWSDIKGIKDIRQYHCFEVFGTNMISSFDTSLKHNHKLHKIKK